MARAAWTPSPAPRPWPSRSDRRTWPVRHARPGSAGQAAASARSAGFCRLGRDPQARRPLRHALPGSAGRAARAPMGRRGGDATGALPAQENRPCTTGQGRRPRRAAAGEIEPALHHWARQTTPTRPDRRATGAREPAPAPLDRAGDPYAPPPAQTGPAPMDPASDPHATGAPPALENRPPRRLLACGPVPIGTQVQVVRRFWLRGARAEIAACMSRTARWGSWMSCHQVKRSTVQPATANSFCRSRSPMNF
jgi:hypothetical protein